MSVILRRNNRIVLYCKGADNVIYDRLGSNQMDIKTRTQEHLNVKTIIHQSFNVEVIKHFWFLEICWRGFAYTGVS